MSMEWRGGNHIVPPDFRDDHLPEREETKVKRQVVHDILLSFIYPPIPDRNFDWQATRKDWEPGGLVGQGRTPIVALADLLEQEMEAEEPGDPK